MIVTLTVSLSAPHAKDETPKCSHWNSSHLTWNTSTCYFCLQMVGLFPHTYKKKGKRINRRTVQYHKLPNKENVSQWSFIRGVFAVCKRKQYVWPCLSCMNSNKIRRENNMKDNLSPILIKTSQQWNDMDLDLRRRGLINFTFPLFYNWKTFAFRSGSPDLVNSMPLSWSLKQSSTVSK